MHPITNTLSTRAGLDAFETTYAHLPITSGAYFAPGKSGAGKRANFGGATAIAMVDHNAIGIRRADVSGVGLSVALRVCGATCTAIAWLRAAKNKRSDKSDFIAFAKGFTELFLPVRGVVQSQRKNTKVRVNMVTNGFV
ncbi:predicted protein [Histoplasma capsulatum G186AR]|uniref:Uncharacterized protein n=1 Tax=Ajellomyces capsulatus (strain G186AR / H82 / ATCC MYA-2454 / RMSCC 2432) TaxID=447093 RepID=C0NF84_AJECG|nr:uncharacterized protein HCBG_01550 [Histoplasma capsulatum G186AR]EEH09905.1 predicted protein [Histoplasma capsulatum G186AR]